MILADNWEEPRKVNLMEVDLSFLVALANSGDEEAVKVLARRIRSES